MDTAKKSVQEIKKHIKDSYNIDMSVLNNLKGKSNLVTFLKSLEKHDDKSESSMDNTNDNIDNIVYGIQSTHKESLKLEPIEPLTPTSPKWSESILNNLADDEKDQGYPKSDGLRRLVEDFICPIKSIDTVVIQTPREDNNWTSTVKTIIYLENGSQYSAVADAVRQYCPKPYDQHLSAIAETRAEGRAYRKILRLKNTATHEEISGETEAGSSQLINQNQKNLIDILCQRLDIHPKKLFDYQFKENKLDDISKYTHYQAAEMGALLSNYQSDIKLIPVEIQGYDASWKF